MVANGFKASVFIATSLDGFIAREDGGLDWLPGHEAADTGGEPDATGYQAFFSSVDALVMGRKSYETVLGFGDEWPYGDKPVLVVSGKLKDSPIETVDVCSSVENVVAELDRRGYRHVYVDGGQLIQEFLRRNAVRRLVITRIPVLLGSGIPLFGKLDHDIPLDHVSTRVLGAGMVQSTYEVRA